MMNQYLKVKDEESLVRDTSSSAILNTDSLALQSYKTRKAKEAAIDRVLREHDELKSELREIKGLLKDLVGQR
jgi:hypothetical protein